MKKYILSSIFCLLSIIGFAQSQKYTISGVITEKESGESIPGVVVLVGNKAQTVSNASGVYSITLTKGTHTITWQFIGCEPHTSKQNVKKNRRLNIKLKQAAINADEVVVTGQSNRLSSMDKQGGISVNLQQLKYMPTFLGEQDVLKYLQLLPGVSSGKEGSSGLNIRGGSADQTLILLDDVPIYNQAHAFGFVSTFSGESIAAAELYKGYSSPIYGGRLSGIVSLLMREGDKYEHKQSIQVGMTTIAANLEGPIKKGKGSYLFSARRFIPDLLLHGYYNLTDEQSRVIFSFYDIAAKVSYDVAKNHSLSLSLYTGNDSFSISETESLENGDSDEKTELSQTNLDNQWGNSIAAIRWNAKIGSKTEMTNTAYYSYLFNKTSTAIEEYVADYKYDNTTDALMEEYGFKSDIKHKMNPNYTLNYGANFSFQSFNPQKIESNTNGFYTHSDAGEQNLVTIAAYLNNEFKINRFDFNAGVRVATYKNDQAIVPSIEPRVSLTYNISEKTSTWLSYVRNSQAISSYYSFIPIDNWLPFSGENVPLSDQYTLGWSTSIKDAIDITTEIYYKNSQNVPLIYNSSLFLSGRGGADIADGRAYGAELSVQYRKNRFRAMVSYNYSRSEYYVDDNWVLFVYDTPNQLNLLGAYDIVKQGDKTNTLSINISYKTGLPYVLSNEVYPNASTTTASGQNSDITYLPEYSNIRLENYFRADINYSLEKRLKKGARIWQLSILNVTNYNNPYMILKIGTTYKSYSIIPFMPSVSYKRVF